MFTEYIIKYNSTMKSFFLISWILLITFPLFSQQVTVEGSVSMLALGDSYTIGERVKEDERWPHQLITLLRALGVSAEFPDYLATSGWTTRNLLGWMQTKLPEDKSYNLVSILIGVNNQYQGMEIAAYEPDLRKIIELALEIVDQDSTRIMILSIPDYAYTPFGEGNTTISQEIDAYNTIKRRVAKEYGIAFIDITDISREGLNNPELVAADGLHPSKEQYALWVQAIVPRMNVNTTLSADEAGHLFNETIELYPNPAGSLVQLNTSQDVERIRIYSGSGKLVLDQGITGFPASIDLSGLERGTYTLCAYPGAARDFLCSALMIGF